MGSKIRDFYLKLQYNQTKIKRSFFLQETNMEETEAGVSDEELWSNVCRGVLRRLELLRDVVTGKSHAKNGGKTKKRDNVQEELLKKYEKDKKEYEMYQGILARDQELFALQQDLYEIKCAALKILNPDCVLPKKPTHNPLPIVKIKEPELPVILQKAKPARNQIGDDTRIEDDANIEDMYAKVNKKDISKNDNDEEEEMLDDNENKFEHTDYALHMADIDTDACEDALVIDSEKLPGFDHRITALMDAKLAYYNECLPSSSSHVRPRNLFPLKQEEAQNSTRLEPIIKSRSSSPFRHPHVYQSNLNSRLYDEYDFSRSIVMQDEPHETASASNRSNLNWVYPQRTPSPSPKRNDNCDSLYGAESAPLNQTQLFKDILVPSNYTHLHDVIIDNRPCLDKHELDKESSLDSSDTYLLLPDSNQSQHAALPTIGENTTSGVTSVETDNALFRTIMNIKTARMRYRIEPNRQNIHRILSLINEEEQGLFEERKNLR